MKIAFFANDKQLAELQEEEISDSRKHLLKVDYFSMEEKLLPMLDCAAYDVIVIYPKGGTASCGEIIRQVDMREKYTAFFNVIPGCLTSRIYFFWNPITGKQAW